MKKRTKQGTQLNEEGVIKVIDTGTTVPSTNAIEIEYDEETQEFYVIWQPKLVVIGSGRTKEGALEDLREAAHLGVDTLIDLKLRDTR